MGSLKTLGQWLPIGILFDFMQKGLLVGITARTGNDVGNLLASQRTFEPLKRVNMAGQDRGGDAPGGLNNTVKCDFNVRVASMCRIERVWRMVDSNNECVCLWLRLTPDSETTAAAHWCLWHQACRPHLNKGRQWAQKL